MSLRGGRRGSSWIHCEETLWATLRRGHCLISYAAFEGGAIHDIRACTGRVMTGKKMFPRVGRRQLAMDPSNTLDRERRSQAMPWSICALLPPTVTTTVVVVACKGFRYGEAPPSPSQVQGRHIQRVGERRDPCRASRGRVTTRRISSLAPSWGIATVRRASSNPSKGTFQKVPRNTSKSGFPVVGSKPFR